MKILVTGSGGFLGHFLVKRLQSEGHEVITFSSKECDLTKREGLNCFIETPFDQIYHLAAWTQAGDFCLHHPGEQWIQNQLMNTHVLDFWQKRQPQAKLIAMGTSCGYDPTLPLEESYYLEGRPIESLFTYGMTKRMLLVGLQSLAKQYGLRYLYVIPSTLYGPNYHTDGRQMHFIFDLMRKILRGQEYHEKVTLWGDGYQKREVVHVEQFVSQLLMINAKVENTLVNIGAGEEFSIREFAQLICYEVGYPFEKIEFDLTKYVGAKSKVLNTSFLKSLLTDVQKIPLQEGIKETLTWMAKCTAML
ncbi:MAG: NAD-dependent epimerase/dehydratase family protein [Simkaniaceae bacterium]|nr:NAD-dependent epimerase/dehydratase family protein [Simkaniaceae bacterium]